VSTTLQDEPLDTWEYPSVSATDVTLDPEDPTSNLGPIRWFEVVDGGTVVFVTGAGRTVTFTGVPAGRAYGVRVRSFTSATGRIRVGW
jgi:hypothetical protein